VSEALRGCFFLLYVKHYLSAPRKKSEKNIQKDLENLCFYHYLCIRKTKKRTLKTGYKATPICGCQAVSHAWLTPGGTKRKLTKT